MNFLFPGFLYGLFAICIPIIIHLFNFRRYKKVYFTNVRFLQELKQESESKSKLKQILILISRILAIAALVFAFAQPFIPSKNKTVKTGTKAISIYIDNSFSMEGISKNGKLLDNAKSKAKELTKAFAPTDKFALLTNDFEGRHQRFLTREEFLQMLDEVKISSSSKNITEVYQRQRDLLTQSDFVDKRIYIVSDFQTNFIKNKRLKNDTLISTTLIPLETNIGSNVFIDTCWFENPIQQKESIQSLHVRIVNKSSKNIESASIRLFINNKLITPGSYSIAPDSKKEVVLNYPTREIGIQNGRIEIEDYPVTYDDKLFFSTIVNTSIPVIFINGAQANSGKRILIKMKEDSLFNLTEMNDGAIDFSAFAKNNLIILNANNSISNGTQQELKKFVNEGGSLAIFPTQESDIETYNQFFNATGLNLFGKIDTNNQICEKINFEQGFYNDVFEKLQPNIDLPKVFNHYSVSKNTKTKEQNIIRLINGMPLLSLYTFGKGKIYLCNTSLEESWSNFERHALFVLSIYKMAINSEQTRQLYYETGKNSGIQIQQKENTKESQYHIVSSVQKTDFIPETKEGENKTLLFTQNLAKLAGNYDINFENKIIAGVSFNYPRQESILEYLKLSDLSKMKEDGTLIGFNILDISEKGVNILISEIEGGNKLWKLFIILCLVFFLLEILLIRFVK